MVSSILEYKPAKYLNPYIEGYWKGIFGPGEENEVAFQMIPNGFVELIIHLNDLHCNLINQSKWAQSPDFMVLGLFTKPHKVKFTGKVKVFSIRFKPEGFYNIFGVPAGKFVDGYQDLEPVLSDAFRIFCEKIRSLKSIKCQINLANLFLGESMRKSDLDLTYINQAADVIRKTKGVKIEDLAHQVHISQRQLEREFKRKLGVTPKYYLRITRLNKVQRLLQEREMDLTSVAYYCGYTDQAHFIKDFKNIIGKNPSIYLRGQQKIISSPRLLYYGS